LRVLEDSVVKRFNSTTLVEVDFRLVAATSRNPQKLVEGGSFRADLCYRLR
jgi:transcriptional regulator with PAS, ATPase and Fis domain